MKKEIKENTTLGKYLLDNGILQYVFAKKVKICAPTLTNLLLGRSTPTLLMAYRIQKETGGKVKMTDWIDLDSV